MKKVSCRSWDEDHIHKNYEIMDLKTADLLQNCDLPPPSKVFKGTDKPIPLSMMNRACRSVVCKDDDGLQEFGPCQDDGGDNKNDKLELLKALRSSQTRAREAEKKAASLAKERECLSNALLDGAMKLYAHRQQVRLLELQVSMLKSQVEEQEENKGAEGSKEGGDFEGKVGMAWIVALALCFGIAIGCSLSCRG